MPATALNMIDMVGIGPFVVLPLVIQIMNGPYFIWAWVLGAVVSLIDAMVWAELGAAYPMAGGSYSFLKIAYGENRWGKLFSFLLVWQTLIQAPLVVASGSIGFAQYASYLVPLEGWTLKAVSGGAVILVVLLLYRRVDSIGRIGMVLWGCVLATVGWIIWGGLSSGHYSFSLPIPEDGSFFSSVAGAGLGAASVKTIYCYLGYYNVCHLGGEIKNPSRIIPLSMFLSVFGIAALYLLMNTSVVSVIPWQEAQNSTFIVSTFIERLYGANAARVATFMVLIVAFSSLFAVLLGYSRVPYAAAADGQFFSIFAKLHPTRQFPYVSLLFLGGVAFVFSLLFKLSDVITAILAMRILVQFIGQAVGLLILHSRKKTSFPFRMPLYPLPVLLAIAVWAFIFISTGISFMLSGLTVIGLGIIAFLISTRIRKQWPFAKAETSQQT
ncbi:APC family permease [Tellurirhabdus bombi]|uniref:APC family permease n=1 Tax=Tellurirhabdus bombi TaxID=2907205 RepID=UPI00387F7C23